MYLIFQFGFDNYLCLQLVDIPSSYCGPLNPLKNINANLEFEMSVPIHPYG